MSNSTSLEGTIRRMLVEYGLFDQQAKEVLAMLKDRPKWKHLQTDGLTTLLTTPLQRLLWCG
jgi:hypothetical protein